MKVGFQQPLCIKINVHKKHAEQRLGEKIPLKPLDLKSLGPGLRTGYHTTGESVGFLFLSAEEQHMKTVVHGGAKANRKKKQRVGSLTPSVQSSLGSFGFKHQTPAWGRTEAKYKIRKILGHSQNL